MSRIDLSLIFALIVLSVQPVFAEETATTLNFESENWTITGGQVVEYLGRRAFAG